MTNNDLEIDLHKAVLPYELKGRKTEPVIGIRDKEFVYVTSINTNLAETYRKALEQMGERTRERVAA